MNGMMPWLLVFFLLFFLGMFLLVLYCVRCQDRALQAIFQQVKASRMEVERLSRALDGLLNEREINDDDILNSPGERPDPALAVPGLDRLLLGEETVPQAESGPASSLPELKL